MVSVLKKISGAVLVASLAFAAGAALQNDVIDDEGNYTILMRPYDRDKLKAGKLPPVANKFKVDRKTWLDIREQFLKLKEIIIRMNSRKELYQRFLDSMGEAESELSDAAVRFIIVIYDDVYCFDRYGNLWIDARFVTIDEMKLVKEVEQFCSKVYNESQKAAQKGDSKLVSRAEERVHRGHPIFRGFEDERYQEHDALILKLVREFNENKAQWAGATEAQARDIPRLRPELVKAHIIEETGGWSKQSTEAWKVDPLQINVPGDWTDQKRWLGIKEPKARNEGTLEQNVRAAIMFLVRKGFGITGQPAANRPDGYFDGWTMALRRYSGRKDETADGRQFKEAYAEHIIRRADEPDRFVPISIQLKKK